MPLYLVDIHDPNQIGVPRVEQLEHDGPDQSFAEGTELTLNDGQRVRVFGVDAADAPYHARLLCSPV